jgi:hypothetical protein
MKSFLHLMDVLFVVLMACLVGWGANMQFAQAAEWPELASLWGLLATMVVAVFSGLVFFVFWLEYDSNIGRTDPKKMLGMLPALLCFVLPLVSAYFKEASPWTYQGRFLPYCVCAGLALLCLAGFMYDVVLPDLIRSIKRRAARWAAA